MFVEIHKLAGSGQTIQYPMLSDEDWDAWRAFLPAQTAFLPAQTFREVPWIDVPRAARSAIGSAAQSGLFDRIEVWGKRNLHKDPIAVGVRLVDGRVLRYLICRWGPDALVPFETIKRRVWLYRIRNGFSAERFENAAWLLAAWVVCWAVTQGFIEVFGW